MADEKSGLRHDAETALFQRVEEYLPRAERDAKRARVAFREIRRSSVHKRNEVLLNLARRLSSNEGIIEIKNENEKDLKAATDNGISGSMLDRLKLDQKRIAAMSEALREIAAFPDPVGEVISGGRIACDVEMVKKRVPLGVVLTVYESRPNVTVDIGALCLKSGNAAILRGGKEALHTNRILHRYFQESLKEASLPADALTFLDETDRACMIAFLQQESLIDLVVPRGGEGLIRFVTQHSRIPVVKHDKGVCNLYVDVRADIEIALRVAINAKLQRPSVCNSIENLLFHKDFADTEYVLNGLEREGALLRGCEKIRAKYPAMTPITGEEEFSTEYLDNRLSVTLVNNGTEAVDFIHKYGSGHSECIISEDVAAVEQFVSAVDSAAVFVNCSTRFHDGGQMGMGAEVGISTGRLHVRGPMGLRDLTTTTYILQGRGQIRQ